MITIDDTKIEGPTDIQEGQRVVFNKKLEKSMGTAGQPYTKDN